MPAGGVSTRVSPVELMGAAGASTGHITVAAVSCPLAPSVLREPRAAQGGPACEGWHSLPQDPGTFARWVSNAVGAGATAAYWIQGCGEPGELRLVLAHWSTGVALCAALTLCEMCVLGLKGARGTSGSGSGAALTLAVGWAHLASTAGDQRHTGSGDGQARQGNCSVHASREKSNSDEHKTPQDTKRAACLR